MQSPICGEQTTGIQTQTPFVYEKGQWYLESPLEEAVSEKDMGVIIDNKLLFQEQIDTKTTKANTIMEIIGRTFNYMEKNNFMQLYRSMIRPHWEVSNSVWIPRQKQVQKRAMLYPGFKRFTIWTTRKTPIATWVRANHTQHHIRTDNDGWHPWEANCTNKALTI